MMEALHALLELSGEALGVLHEGRITWLNSAGAGFGLRVGTLLSECVITECEGPLLNALEAEGTRTLMVRMQGINVKWLNFTFRGEGGEVLFGARDITAIRESEQLMSDYIADIHRRTTEIEQFAYAASHDIQEPLRTITNYLAILLEDHAYQLSEEAQDLLQNVGDAAKHCRELVRALMGYSSLGRNPRFARVTTEAEVKRVLSALELSIRDSRCTITCGDLPDVYGDAALLRVVFTNLISNALKFAHPGKPPLVKIGASESEERWLFWVTDDGIGIEEKYAAQIFEVFRRLDKTKPGVGIGLASAKKAVSIHLGQLWVESSSETGSTFYFTVERPHDSEDTFGGRSSTRRQGAAASPEEIRGTAHAIRSGRWRGCDAVLAWKGLLSRGDTSGSYPPRSKAP